MFWLALAGGLAVANSLCNYINRVDQVIQPIGYCAGTNYDSESQSWTSFRFRCVDTVGANLQMDFYDGTSCQGNPICTMDAQGLDSGDIVVNCDQGDANPFCPYLLITDNDDTTNCPSDQYRGYSALIGTDYCINNPNVLANETAGRAYKSCNGTHGVYDVYNNDCSVQIGTNIGGSSCPNAACTAITSDPGYPSVPTSSTGSCGSHGGGDDGPSFNLTNYDPFPSCNWLFFGDFFSTVGNCAHIESGSETLAIKGECPTANGEPVIYGWVNATDCTGDSTWNYTWTNFAKKPDNAVYSCSQGNVANSCPYTTLKMWQQDNGVCHASHGYEINTLLLGCVATADGGSVSYGGCSNGMPDWKFYNETGCTGSYQSHDTGNCTDSCATASAPTAAPTTRAPTTSNAWMSVNVSFLTLLSLISFTFAL